MKNITSKAIIDSLLAAGYITAVGNFLSYAENFFDDGKTVLIPIVMLLLFVISAGITSSLVFGRSVL